VILILCVLSGTIFRDATRRSNQSEWSACDRPLGAWACLWILRVIVAFILSYWDYLREREAYVMLFYRVQPYPDTHPIRLQLFTSGAPIVVRRGNRNAQVSRSDQRRLQPIGQQGMILSPPNATFTRYVPRVRSSVAHTSLDFLSFPL